MYTNELYHYGVKGMRWGVRHDRSGVGGLKEHYQARKKKRQEAKRRKALDVRTSARYTYRQRKLLTDEELRYRINRLNMERQLRDLSRSSSPFPSFSDDVSVSTGRKAAQKALGIYGAKIAVSQISPEAARFVKTPK